jgi:hypothetical protein
VREKKIAEKDTERRRAGNLNKKKKSIFEETMFSKNRERTSPFLCLVGEIK